jgi:hypothetical protein
VEIGTEYFGVTVPKSKEASSVPVALSVAPRIPGKRAQQVLAFTGQKSSERLGSAGAQAGVEGLPLLVPPLEPPTYVATRVAACVKRGSSVEIGHGAYRSGRGRGSDCNGSCLQCSIGTLVVTHWGSQGGVQVPLSHRYESYLIA